MGSMRNMVQDLSQRFIDEKIKKPLADELLFGKLKNGGSVKVDKLDTDSELSIYVNGKKLSNSKKRKKPKALCYTRSFLTASACFSLLFRLSGIVLFSVKYGMI